MSEIVENVQVRERFEVDNDMKAEWCIAKIRKARREQQEQKEELARQMKFYQDQMDFIDKKTDEDVSFFESILREYFEHRASDGFAKETKTKISYKLPSGELILKHQEPEYEYKTEQDKAIEYCEQNGLTQYIKVEKKLAWSDLKKKVSVSGDGVVLKETGEIVPGIKVTEREDKFEVEVK